MAEMTLPELSRKLAAIDIAMLSTRSDGGMLTARPMSNNGEVDADGASHYFTYDRSRTVADVGRDAHVALAFKGDDGFWATVVGRGELIRDKAQFQAHWVPDLKRWFEQGVDTPGLVLLKVRAERVKYWAGEQDGELVL